MITVNASIKGESYSMKVDLNGVPQEDHGDLITKTVRDCAWRVYRRLQRKGALK